MPETECAAQPFAATAPPVMLGGHGAVPCDGALFVPSLRCTGATLQHCGAGLAAWVAES